MQYSRLEYSGSYFSKKTKLAEYLMLLLLSRGGLDSW